MNIITNVMTGVESHQVVREIERDMSGSILCGGPEASRHADTPQEGGSLYY